MDTEECSLGPCAVEVDMKGNEVAFYISEDENDEHEDEDEGIDMGNEEDHN
jgi:hypothetical protein